MENNHYHMLILSGPSGAGKSTLTKVLQEQMQDFYFSVSTTTRQPRENEQHGREYFFVSKEKFLEDIKAGEFLEYEEVHGNFYGTGKSQILEAIKKGKFIVFDVDVKGHNNLKAHYSLAQSVFITTKDLETLKERLLKRNTDNDETIQKRLINAYTELKYANTFDYLLINDNITDAKEDILHIAKSMILKNHIARFESLLKDYEV